MNAFYYGMEFSGILLALAYLFWISPKFGLGRIRSVICISLGFLLGIAAMKLLYFAVTGSFGGQTATLAFVFVPILVLLPVNILKMPVKAFLDASAPVACIAYGITKIGCQYVGCCRSWLAVDWGIFNRFRQTNLFPIQLLECAVSLGIAALLIVICSQKKFQTGGRQMPLMLILFGSARFLFEFLRESEKIFLGLSELSFWALLTVCEGAVWLWIVRRGRKNGEKPKAKSDLTA